MKPFWRKALVQASNPAPASVQRPIGDAQSFLEDVRARGFSPKGILDVGANRGNWSVMALSIYPASRALLIEPQDEVEYYLAALCAKDKRCRYVKCGAGRQEEDLTLTLWEDTYGSSFSIPRDDELMATGRQRAVKVRTLDAILREQESGFKPELVKLDVQGFELEALSGGQSLFGVAEVFIIETTLLTGSSSWPTSREVIDYMSERNYEIYDITSYLRKPSDGSLGQIDFAFVKADGVFRQNFSW